MLRLDKLGNKETMRQNLIETVVLLFNFASFSKERQTVWYLSQVRAQLEASFGSIGNRYDTLYSFHQTEKYILKRREIGDFSLVCIAK